jgi:trans-aconitate 2-methyltransferase
MRYTFGTDGDAARRLETIARFFNPLAARLVAETAPGPVGTALDLGCGPGFTTEMLRGALDCADVWGVDRSAAFLDMARERFGACRFVEHDVTTTPFPVRADVIYVRFVLTHLPGAVELVGRWVSELQPDGLIIIDEPDAIETEIPVFRRYLEVAEALVASQGGDLWVGRTLARGSYDADIVRNEVVELPVTNAEAAGWFRHNPRTVWEREPVVLDMVPPAERAAVADEMDRIAESGESQPGLSYSLRRLVLRRT